MVTRKINFVLCILIVLVIIGQFYFVFQPYINYAPKLTKYEMEVEGKVAKATDFSLMEVVWTDYYKIQKEYLLPELEEADMIHVKDAKGNEVKRPTDIQKLDAAGEMSNGFVMGIVGVNVLGIVVLIMTIFTRKSLVHYLFSLAWAICSVYAFYADNFILNNLAIESAAKTVLPWLQYLSIAAAALVVLRGYPWFYSRYIHKEKLDLEALNA